MQIHPAAELFPMLDDADLGMLADDIRKNGLIEPIILHHGQILDGRNRFAACTRAGVDPQFIEMDEVPSPVVYVLSRNLHRRHLTCGQRSQIAADVVPMLEEEAKQRQTSSLKQNQQLSPSSQICDNGNDEPKEQAVGRSTEIAAELVGVSPRSVQKAVRIKKEDPALAEQVKRGEVSLNAADEEIQERVDSTTKRQRQLADSAKQKMVTALSTANGICIGLDGLDVEKVVAACDAKEIRSWAEKSRELANKFRSFAKRLEKAE